jgi:tetratricopeptide (TPR) repeat protein
MQPTSYVTVAISLFALAISIYGVAERRNAAKRAERLRLATIIDELNGLHLEHLQAPDGLTDGDITDAINARRELLAVQSLSLLDSFRKTTTSPEYRTLAHALSRAGYPNEADEVWRKAISTALREGATQSLFAYRGYACFLFAEGRADDARTQMRKAIDAIGQPDDDAIVKKIQTLKYWAEAEREASPEGSAAATLLAEAAETVGQLAAAHLQQRMRAFLQVRLERDSGLTP